MNLAFYHLKTNIWISNVSSFEIEIGQVRFLVKIFDHSVTLYNALGQNTFAAAENLFGLTIHHSQGGIHTIASNRARKSSHYQHHGLRNILGPPEHFVLKFTQFCIILCFVVFHALLFWNIQLDYTKFWNIISFVSHICNFS